MVGEVGVGHEIEMAKLPNPNPRTPNPKSQTPNPKPQTQNPKPKTQNPKPKTVTRDVHQVAGDDFKSGQTKIKSVLVDYLVSAGIKVRRCGACVVDVVVIVVILEITIIILIIIIIVITITQR